MEDQLRVIHNRVIDARSESDWEAVLSLVKMLPSQEQVRDLPCARKTLNTVAHIVAADNRVSDLESASQVHILRELHSRNFNLRQRNARNLTPLAVASKHKNNCLTVVSFLLDSVYSPVERLFYGGDDTDERMQSEFTAHPEEYNAMTWLGVCIEEGRFDQARWLLENGASPSVKDVCSNTILHMIPYGSCSNPGWNTGTFCALTTHDSFSNDSTLSPSQVKLLDFLEYVLSFPVVAGFVDAKNDIGDAPVHVVAEMSSDPRLALWALKILKCHGATIELENQDHSNIAMLAARAFGDGPWLGIVFDRLGSGLDPNAADVAGERLEDYIVDAEVDLDDFSIEVDESDDSFACDDHLD